MKRREQLARLSEQELSDYKKSVGIAVVCGLGQLWTFPLFSWPTIYPVLYELNGHDTKLTMLQITFGSFIPLFIVAAIFGFLARHFQRKARKIRETATEPLLTSKNKEETPDER
jgi:hypothetical protein